MQQAYISKNNSSKQSRYRPEIDGLRAFAVIAVIINHFNKDILPGGYLGVDIFFVISGFVITSSLNQRPSKNFKDFISGFYERRIKRLIPALSIFVVPISIAICLFNSEPGVILRTGITSLFGLSNLYLLRQATDYFAQSTELNVFTQTWSLGVEEQFYILFPFLIWFSGFGRQKINGARNLFLIMGALAIASLIGFLYLYPINQSAAYFLMPTRFWEMASGCLLFIGFQKRKSIELFLNKVPSLFLLTLIIGVMYLPMSLATISTVAVVVLSLGLISSLKQGTALYTFFTNSKVVYIGLISYSLYLWHWGVLSISRWTIGIHWWSIPFQIALMLVLAIASYRWIETPLRKSNWFGERWKTIIFNGGVLILISTILIFFNIFSRKLYIFDFINPNASDYSWGQELDCHGIEDFSDLANPYKYCLKLDRTSNQRKRIFIIGDSHAAQLVFPVRKSFKNSDFKVGFINSGHKKDFPKIFLREKVDLKKTPTIEKLLSFSREEDIVLVGMYKAKLNKDGHAHIEKTPSRLYGKSLNLLSNLNALAQSLNNKKIKLVLILDSPMLKTNTPIETCKFQQRLFNWNNCDISPNTDFKTGWQQRKVYQEVAKTNANVFLYDLSQLIPVNNKGYFSYQDDKGMRIFVDNNHLTKEFSESLSGELSTFIRSISKK